jgi:dihydroorotase
MSIQDVILRTTLNPANAINRKELGNLSPGVEADIAVFKIVEGDYGFMDSSSRRFNGTARLQTELTLRAGRIVWNLNGLGSPMWNVDVKY